MNTLLLSKRELESKIIELQQTIANKDKQYETLSTDYSTLKHHDTELQVKHSEVQQQLSVSQNETHRERKKLERFQSELTNLKEINNQYKQEVSIKSQSADQLAARLSDGESKIRSLTLSNERCASVIEELKLKADDAEKELQLKLNLEKNLLIDRAEAMEAVSSYKRELQHTRNEINSVTKARERLSKQLEQEQKSRAEAEKYRSYLKDQLRVVVRNLEVSRQQCDVDERAIASLGKQVKALESQLQLAEEKLSIQDKLLQEIDYIKKERSQADSSHMAESHRLHQQLLQVERINQNNLTKQHEWQERCGELQLQIQQHLSTINELKQCVSGEKKKYALQFSLYESLRVEKNHLSKAYLQAEDEQTELYRKYKVMAHQHQQLKSELLSKDEQLLSEHLAYKRLQQELKLIKRKLSKRKQLLDRCDQVLESQNREILTLRKTLLEIEILSKNQRQVYDSVVKERDLLGSQLITRNEELALVEEKIRIYTTTLTNGEAAYRARLVDIKSLKQSTGELSRQLALAQSELVHIDALKSEIYTTQRQLLTERTKVKSTER